MDRHPACVGWPRTTLEKTNRDGTMNGLTQWIWENGAGLVGSVVTALGVYAAIVVFTRLAGLRTFSKLSSFDFALTVAFGSLLATTILSPDPPLLRSVVALASLYLLQYTVSRIRLRGGRAASVFDNEPLLLMDGPEILQSNLDRGRVTRDDLRAKLREANVLRWEQVRAVVLETTGDISVIHGDPGAPALEPELLAGVRRGVLTDAPR